jgi:hypothetical protein
MDLTQILENALKNPERDWLDFKSILDLSAEDKKAELVKDISAMANTVDIVGYIVIGVFWKPGEIPAFTNFQGGIEPACLQQIVRSKINKPIRFEYEEFKYPNNGIERTIGIISVPYSDAKPHQVKTQDGRPGQVFIRRDSATDSATVEEIIEMSLNAVNDLSKIEEDDLAARVVVLLRRGDHVGIREMITNAPRDIEQTLSNLPSKDNRRDRKLSLLNVASKLADKIADCCDRISVLGFAIIRHRCFECYDDLLKCLARLYIASRSDPEFNDAAVLVWRRILALAAYATSWRNWDYLDTFLHHRVTFNSGERKFLFLNPLTTDTNENANAVGRLLLGDSPDNELKCDTDNLNYSLFEYDFLAHHLARRMGENIYEAFWFRRNTSKEWIASAIEELSAVPQLAVLFKARPTNLQAVLQGHYKMFVHE